MSVIYFVQAGTNGPIKIGVTSNLTKRLATMAIDNPAELRLIGTIEGDQPLEQAIHRHLWRDRVHGEWFNLNERVLSLIANALVGNIQAALQLGEDERASQLERLDQVGSEFAQLTRETFQRLVDTHGISGVARHASVSPWQIRQIIEREDGPVSTMFAVAGAFPKETEALQLAGVHLPRANRASIEQARDALDELLRKIVRAA